MPVPTVGDRLPSLRFTDQHGVLRTPADWKGKSLLLFVYPEAGSPGCTKQACGYRDLASRFRELGIELAGLSPDDPEDLGAFDRANKLGMTLLADARDDAGVPVAAKALGLWREKSLYGRTYVGLVRSTILIGPDGRIARVWDNVKATGQAEQILKELELAATGAIEGESKAGSGGQRASTRNGSKVKKPASAKSPENGAAKKRPTAKKKTAGKR